MRVLFSAKHPPRGGVAFGGVASWINTVRLQLERRDIECAVWGVDHDENKRYDVGIIANAGATRRAIGRCDRHVNISHGIVDDEMPGDGRLICTSAEVADRWGGGVVINQPIDTDYWYDAGEDRRGLVFYSYRAPDAFSLPAVADALGVPFLWLRNVRHSQARKVLRRAALVCASGRAALEAMACGAPTLICDWRPYQGGPVVQPDTGEARFRNYSGRGGYPVYSADMASLAAAKMMDKSSRNYVFAHHDADKVAGRIIEECLRS